MTTIPESPSPAVVMSRRLYSRDLQIKPAEIEQGLAMLEARGIKGDDAETGLFNFLERLSPHGELGVSETPVRPMQFMGWDALSASFRLVLDGLPMQLRDEVLARKWGTNGVRVALVIYTHGKATS